MKLTDIVIYNRAPFEYYTVHFTENEPIVVFNGINGSGKTTILSYIVDSFYELAKKAFTNEFDQIRSHFYRLSSSSYNVDPLKPSFVYLRYSVLDKYGNHNNIDYIDLRSEITEEDYGACVDLDNKIPWIDIIKRVKNNGLIKYWSITDKKEIEKLFQENILTYFPAYRYELPAYINSPYKMNMEYTLQSSFAGYLPNPIEVTSDLKSIANWIMDVVLDNQIYKDESFLMNRLQTLFTLVLLPKLKQNVRLGIGKRQHGDTRISIMANNQEETLLYPSIFFMSSGELALSCLFCEVLKQADNISRLSNSKGIVLIDEVDKHLHVTLQKDVLPLLMGLFPNVQFIITTHSPFVSLGLHNAKLSFNNIDFDQGGVSCPYEENDLYLQVYNLMINKNRDYKKQYDLLLDKVKKAKKPIIITEGKTDWRHLKKAFSVLDTEDLDVEFYEFDETLGDTRLEKMLFDYARINTSKPVIGMFDRDNLDNLKIKDLAENDYIKLGNNVFAFSIPIVNSERYGDSICIEQYYPYENIKTEHDGRSLFLGEEFYSSGVGKCSTYQTKCKQIENKVKTNGIIDEKVYDVKEDPEFKHSIAMSKAEFAELVLNDPEFASSFDFSNFQLIIDVIKNILHSNEGTG